MWTICPVFLEIGTFMNYIMFCPVFSRTNKEQTLCTTIHFFDNNGRWVWPPSNYKATLYEWQLKKLTILCYLFYQALMVNHITSLYPVIQSVMLYIPVYVQWPFQSLILLVWVELASMINVRSQGQGISYKHYLISARRPHLWQAPLIFGIRYYSVFLLLCLLMCY